MFVRMSMRACTFEERRTSLMRFYVNKYAQPTGEHEVHRANCAWLPGAENRICLGGCATSRAAVKEERKDYGWVDGCKQGRPERPTRQARYRGPPAHGRATYLF